MDLKKRYIQELKIHQGTVFTLEQRLSKQQWLDKQPIIFMEEGISHFQFLHDDLLVITIQLANQRVRKILIDNGSSVNVLFKSTL